jgi:hypothetical protein
MTRKSFDFFFYLSLEKHEKVFFSLHTQKIFANAR